MAAQRTDAVTARRSGTNVTAMFETLSERMLHVYLERKEEMDAQARQRASISLAAPSATEQQHAGGDRAAAGGPCCG